MTEYLQLKITTPNGIYINKKIIGIELKTSIGKQTFLAKHLNTICDILPDYIYIYNENGNKEEYVIGSGALLFKNNVLTIVVDFINKKPDTNVSAEEYVKQQILLKSSKQKNVENEYAKILEEIEEQFNKF
jgi:F-type H+-transporting ATPase subunit epsilon